MIIDNHIYHQYTEILNLILLHGETWTTIGNVFCLVPDGIARFPSFPTNYFGVDQLMSGYAIFKTVCVMLLVLLLSNHSHP